jgi:phosphomethylpyrimidine synthase
MLLLFRQTIALTFLVPTITAFTPASLTSPIAQSSLRVLTDPTADLVTKEANVKSVKRTKPTVDPFNPEFERIRSVPYHDAFP